MPSDVTITSALRNNLLSMQGTQRNSDQPQKTKSADGSSAPSYAAPENLLAPKSLNDRASDLQRILDGINQSIRTLEVASNSAAKLSELLGEAEGFASNVLEGYKSGSDIDFSLFSREAGGVLTKIDQIISESSYKGTNLLKGDILKTNFSDTARRPLTTEGADFSSQGLSLGGANVSSVSEVEVFVDVVRGAQLAVNDFSQSLKADLSLVQTRRDFTQETVSTLTAGTDDLVVADQSEEAANLLALRTRQDLTASDLPLASDAQSSVFKLF